MTSPSRPAPSQRPTYEDILALPPGVNGEILGGELVVSPRPAAPHTRAASVLGVLLGNPFHLGLGGPGGWWILDEPELSLGVDPDYDPVIPDLAGWRIETLPEIENLAQFHVVPDWVCEVVSPSTVRHDRILKLPFYGRAGVGYAWLIDPIAETIEVYRADADGAWTLAQTAAGDERHQLEPFDAVALDLCWLWGRRPPEELETTSEP